MKIKKLIIIVLLALSGLLLVNSRDDINVSSSSSLKSYSEILEHSICEVTYERVLIDGLWWIIVYDDGVKINEYPDPIQS